MRPYGATRADGAAPGRARSGCGRGVPDDPGPRGGPGRPGGRGPPGGPGPGTLGAMPWLELTDLPFAAALQPHQGGLELGGDYDCAHFDQAAFEGADAANSRF